MAVLDCATAHISVGTNMLGSGQMGCVTQKIQLKKCFFLLAVLQKRTRKKQKYTAENNRSYY